VKAEHVGNSSPTKQVASISQREKGFLELMASMHWAAFGDSDLSHSA
jgi:hypothetical protein